MARRTVFAALVAGAAALALTGCIGMPPASPPAPPAPTLPTQPAPAPSDDDAPEPEPTADQQEPSTGDYQFTVDDGAGDTWSFSITGVEDAPPMQSGSAAAGHHLVGVLIDARHDVGSASFTTCFDIIVVGSDGVEYDFGDTIANTAENDIFYQEAGAGTEFQGARATVQLPDGVEPAQVVLRSSFGQPQVPDSIVDVQ